MKINTNAFRIILAIGVALATRASFAATISIANHELQPDTPGQIIQIWVSGGDLVQGLNLNVQIGDGLQNGLPAPIITDADVLEFTIFQFNNTGQDDPGSLPHLAIRTTTTAQGTVAASGLLATLTLDTTGLTSGTWPLILSDTLNGPTDFAGLPITITDGRISIIPEPASAWFWMAATAAAIISRRQLRGGNRAFGICAFRPRA